MSSSLFMRLSMVALAVSGFGLVGCGDDGSNDTSPGGHSSAMGGSSPADGGGGASAGSGGVTAAGGGGAPAGGGGAAAGAGGAACPVGTVEPKGTLATVTLSTNDGLNVDPATADVMFIMNAYLSDYSVYEYLPPVTFGITTFPVVTTDGTIYVAANTNLYQRTTAGVITQVGDRASFWLSLGDNAKTYSNFPVWCGPGDAHISCVYEYDITSSTETCLAYDLDDNIGFLQHFAGPANGYLFLDIDGVANRLEVANGTLDTAYANNCSSETYGPKTIDSNGELYTLGGTTIYRVDQQDCSSQPVVCFDWPAGEPATYFVALVKNDAGDFFLTEGPISLEAGDANERLGQRVFKVDGLTGELTTFANNLGGTWGMALDPTDQSLVVAELASGSLRRIDTSGTVSALEEGNYTANPWDLVFLSNGDMLVTQTESGLLLRATAAPDLSTIELSPYLAGFNFFDQSAIAIDAAGVIYAAEYAPNIVRLGVSQIDTNGTVSWFTQQPDSPDGVAVDDSGNVWVSNALSGLVQKYDSSGTFVGETAALNNPGNLVWHQGAVYVSERGVNQVTKIDANTFATSCFAQYSNFVRELVFAPSGKLVATAGAGLWLADEGGTPIQLGGTTGTGNSFNGMVFKDNELYIAMAPSHVVRITGPFN